MKLFAMNIIEHLDFAADDACAWRWTDVGCTDSMRATAS